MHIVENFKTYPLYSMCIVENFEWGSTVVEGGYVPRPLPPLQDFLPLCCMYIDSIVTIIISLLST